MRASSISRGTRTSSNPGFRGGGKPLRCLSPDMCGRVFFQVASARPLLPRWARLGSAGYPPRVRPRRPIFCRYTVGGRPGVFVIFHDMGTVQRQQAGVDRLDGQGWASLSNDHCGSLAAKTTTRLSPPSWAPRRRNRLGDVGRFNSFLPRLHEHGYARSTRTLVRRFYRFSNGTPYPERGRPYQPPRAMDTVSPGQ